MSEDKDLQSEMSYFQRAMELFSGRYQDIWARKVLLCSVPQKPTKPSVFFPMALIY